MALIEIQGFDHQNSSTDLIANQPTVSGPWYWSVLTLSGTLLVPGRFTGGKALALGTTGIFGGTNLTAFAAATVIVGCAVKVPSSGSALIGFWDSVTQDPTSGTMQLSMLLQGSTGVISIYRGSTSGTLLHATSGNQFPRNVWFYLELKPKVDASTGSIAIQLRGNPYLSLTGLNTQAGGVTRVDSLFFGGGGSAVVDDVYIADTTTGPGANPFSTFQGTPSFPGGLRVFTRFPSANGVTIDFTPLSGANYTQVQEHAMDGDATYNWDVGTLNDEDLFAADPTPVDVTPLACKVQGAYREAGTGQLWDVVNRLRSGTTEFSGSPVNIFPTYTYQSDVYPQNPDGDVPWTKSAIDASQVGYQVVSSTIIFPPPPSNLRIVTTATLETTVSPSVPSRTFTLSVPVAHAVIVVHVCINSTSSAAPTVSSISDTSGLVWTRRKRVQGAVTGVFLGGDDGVTSELWWAVATSSGSIDITVDTTTAAVSFTVMTGMAVEGANTTTPWDVDGSLPASASQFAGTATTPQVTGISTTNPDTLVLFVFDEFSVVAALAGPPGYTRAVGGQTVNAFVNLYIEDTSFYSVVSAPLVSQTLAGTTSVGDPSRWIVIVDGIQAA